MSPTRRLDLVWFLLIGLTIGGAALGEAERPDIWVTLVVAGLIAIKGRLVIDHFMELTHANRHIRRTVRLYGVAIPLLLVLTHLFGPQVARMTQL